MATKKKAERPDVNTEGVPVRTDRFETVNRHEDGVPVLTPETPAQTAGTNDGQSAGNKE